MLEHILDNITHYFELHPHMGVFFAFIVAFLESLPIIGVIVPGSITMTAIGVLIGAGLLPGYLTLAIASLGALLGDVLSFALGRIFDDRLPQIWPFKKHPKIISLSTLFIKKHGGKSILIGRFVGAVRSAIPLVAGLLHLSWTRFMIAIIPTALLWTLVYSLPGIIFGAFSLEIPAKLLTKYLIIGIGVILLLWFLFWLIQHFFRNIRSYYYKKIHLLWLCLKRHSNADYWIVNELQLSHFLLACLSFILFLLIALNVAFRSVLLHLNMPLFDFSQSFRIYHLDPFFTVITLLGSPAAATSIGLSISFLLCIAKQYRSSLHLGAITIITAGFVELIKKIVHSPRPSGFLAVNTSSSFPSGHTTLSLVVFGFLAFLLAQQFKKQKSLLYLVTGVLIALIAISRLFLGAHWFLDVVAALFLGFAILLLSIVHYQRLPSETYLRSTFQRMPMILLGGCIILAIELMSIQHNYRITLSNTTPLQEKMSLQSKLWWQHPLTYTPLYRKNRFGYAIQPLNIQWAGSIANIKMTLLHNGWSVINRNHHVQDTIQRLSSTQMQYHLPIFELLYQNKRPSLVMSKSAGQSTVTYILHLWNSHIELDNHTPLWIGMLSRGEAREPSAHQYNLLSFTNLDTPLLLFNRSAHWQIRSLTPPPDKLTTHPLKYLWDQTLWLIRSN